MSINLLPVAEILVAFPGDSSEVLFLGEHAAP